MTVTHGQALRDNRRTEVLAVVERHLRAGATYADLNAADIAAEAGISRSTFYAYFVDKATLLGTWYVEATERVLAAAREWWSLDSSVTRDSLRAALASVVEAHLLHPELMAATHESIGSDHGVREAVDVAMDRFIDGLRDHIRAGQVGGYVDPSLLPEETAYWLQWMAERVLHRVGRGGTTVELSKLIEAYTGIVWNTLYAHGTLAASQNETR